MALVVEYDDEEIIESDERVKVKLSDIQRVVRQLHKFTSLHQEREEAAVRNTREAEETNEEYNEWPNGHAAGEEEQEEEEGETIEDEDDEQEQDQEPEEEKDEEPEQEEQQKEEQEEEEEKDNEETPEGEEKDEVELEPLEEPSTPNGTKHVSFFGTPSPPATPPHTSPPESPKTPKAPSSPPSTSYPTSPSSPLPSNEAEKDRLANEWKRRVASSANKYSHSRIPLSSSKRLYPESARSYIIPHSLLFLSFFFTCFLWFLKPNEALKTKFEGLTKIVSESKPPSEVQFIHSFIHY